MLFLPGPRHSNAFQSRRDCWLELGFGKPRRQSPYMPYQTRKPLNSKRSSELGAWKSSNSIAPGSYELFNLEHKISPTNYSCFCINSVYVCRSLPWNWPASSCSSGNASGAVRVSRRTATRVAREGLQSYPKAQSSPKPISLEI